MASVKTVAYAEIVLGVLVLIVTLVSYVTDYWKHGDRLTATYAILGILVLIVGAWALRIKPPLKPEEKKPEEAKPAK